MKHRTTIEDLRNKLRGSPVEALNPHLFEDARAEKPKKKNKFNASKTEVDGIVFDSKKEATRYKQLKILQKAGLIGFLKLQVEYKLECNGEKVASYIADFEYVLTETGEKVVEDVKSDVTRKLPTYRLKKKLMKAMHGIEIKEV
jgi:hypothetical protein